MLSHKRLFNVTLLEFVDEKPSAMWSFRASEILFTNNESPTLLLMEANIWWSGALALPDLKLNVLRNQ